MERTDIIIIGAGAAGLAAARELTIAGKSVILIESKDRAGGRILTFRPPGFSENIEAGAEFIHGDAPVTENLLKKAGISKIEMSGKTYRYENNKLFQSDEFVDNFSFLIEKMNKLEKDIPLQQFMEENFNDEKYVRLNKSLRRLVEGYDAANMNIVSTFSIREELFGGGIEKSFRPENGYNEIIDYLVKEVKKNSCKILFSTTAKEINWDKEKVEVLCNGGKSFAAEKVLITLSPAVLLAREGKSSAIKFSPDISPQLDLFKQIGFGTVIKIIVEFVEPFWEKNNSIPVSIPGLDFLLSDTIPVTAWWTQLPDKKPVLTAWMAGPNADKIKGYGSEDLFEIVLSILAKIFKVHENVIKGMVKAKYVANWSGDQNFCGAYSFSTIHSSSARKKISQSIENTIYFAGEALYNGETAGTVEAALANGIETAKKMIS